MVNSNTGSTLFVDTDSWLRRIHPFTKLAYILLTGAMVYCGIFGWYTALFLISSNLLLAVSANIAGSVWRSLVRILLPLMLFMIPIHGFLHPDNQTVWMQAMGLTVYEEGLVFALSILVKLAAVLTASLLFVFTTHPADLITAISDTARSPSLAYLLGSPLLLLESMRERIDTIQSAQRARGLQTGGNLFLRARGLVPLVFPLIIGSFIEVEQRSIALEIRGFRSGQVRTVLRPLADSTLQRCSRWLMCTAALGLLLLRCFR